MAVHARTEKMVAAADDSFDRSVRFDPRFRPGLSPGAFHLYDFLEITNEVASDEW